ncbi:MAG: phosphodiester glycosidase family protein [Clostridia bacterium]
MKVKLITMIFVFTTLFSAYANSAAITLTETKLVPGIYYSKKTTENVYKANVNVFITRLDLRTAGLSVKPLVSNSIRSSMTVMSYAKYFNTNAAINASFFSWEGNGNNVRGPIVKSYQLLESSIDFNATSDVYACLYQKKTGAPKISYLHPYLYVKRADGKQYKISSLNTEYKGQTTLCQYDSNYTAESIGNSKYSGVSELVVTNGIMTELRVKQAKTTIPSNGYVITSTGSGATLLSNIFQKGVALKFIPLANNTPAPTPTNPKATPVPQLKLTEFKYCVPGGSVLLKDGVIPSDFSHVPGKSASYVNPIDPRTAVGISKDGNQMYFVVADGRYDKYKNPNGNSNGMSMKDLATFMLDLGAWNAINFDGGASSTMVTQTSADVFATRNIPYARDGNGDGSRSVAIALGAIYVVPPPTPVPTKTPVPTLTPTPTRTPTPTPTPTPSPTPKPTPTPTPKPTPTPTPAPPIITVNSYPSKFVNTNIKVTAKTNKGKLNFTSHTFKVNGSFTFVATAKGKITKKTIVIKNIDKVKPLIKVTTTKDLLLKNKSQTKGIVKLVVTDANLLSKTIKKNGTAITWPATGKMKGKGAYTLTAIDKAGNKKIFSFKLS